MRKTILLCLFGILCAFLFSSCEKRDELQELDIENKGVATRAFHPTIDGPITVYEGEVHDYYLLNAYSYIDIYWTNLNAEELYSYDNHAIFYFPSTGTSRIYTEFTNKDTWYTSSAYLDVNVLPFEVDGFLNNLGIIGKKETDPGVQLTYKLSSPSRLFVLEDVTWKLEGITSGWEPTFTHTFFAPGTYKLECSGTFSSVTTATSIPFTKSINVVVAGAIPMSISGSNYAETRNFYSFTVNYPSTGTHQIEWSFPAGVQCVYSNNNKTIQLKFPTSGSFDIKCRAIHDTYTTDWEVKTIKVLDNIYDNQWYLLNPTKTSNRALEYDIVFRPTQKCYLRSLYITCLYNGAYDGYYSNVEWDWEYHNKYKIYYPNEIDTEYGSINKIRDYYNGESTTITIGAGELYLCHVIHYIEPEKRLEDIEYVIFYVCDNLRSGVDRYSDLYDFKY